MKKKSKINKNVNQKSFYFEDYLETSNKNKKFKKTNNFQDRSIFYFFLFFFNINFFDKDYTCFS